MVAPGLVDLHTHLREPGREEAETVETGARAAALRRLHRGGRHAQHRAGHRLRRRRPPGARSRAPTSCCDVAVAGAITVGRQGSQLAPMAEMAALGVRLFTDDGTGVQDARLMRRALEYASVLGVTLAQHCEDAALAGGGPHARRGVVEPPRHPGQPGRGRGAHGDAGPGPVPV